jgi:membrane protease YdiL (CAAX protease family)
VSEGRDPLADDEEGPLPPDRASRRSEDPLLGGGDEPDFGVVFGDEGGEALERRRRLRRLAVVGSAVAALVVWVVLVLHERKAPVPEGAALTESQLQDRLESNGPGFAAVLLLKFGAGIAGIVLVILYASRRRAIRRGLLPPPPPRPPPRTVLPLFWALAVFVAYVGALSLAQGALVRLEERGTFPKGTSTTLEAGLVVTHGVGLPFALAILWARRRLGPGSSLPLGAKLSAALRVFLVSAAVTVALGLVAMLVMKHAFELEPRAQVAVQKAIESPSPRLFWVLGVFGVVVAPLVEETLFRGLLYPAARAVGGPTVAAFGVSIVFAAVHMSAGAYLPLLGLALVLAGLYEATDSILAVTLVHALSNATSLVPIFLLAGA